MTVSVEKINRFKNVLLFESLKLKEKTCIFTTWLGLLKQVNEYSYISAMTVGQEKKSISRDRDSSFGVDD